MPPSHFHKIHFNIILLFMRGSSKWSLSLRISHQNPVCTFPLPHTCYMPRKFHSSRSYHPNNVWWGVRIIKLLITLFFHSTVTSSLLGPNISFSTLFSNTLNLRPSFNVSEQVSHPYKTIGKIIVLCILSFIFLGTEQEDKGFCGEMTASILWLQSALNFFLNRILIR
jgi:hypothetical protein